jgi:hypothetical protein
MFDEYYGIVLHFIRRFPTVEEMPEFFRQIVQPNFMLFESKMKAAFVYAIENVVGNNLFDRLQFFFRNQDTVMTGVKTGQTDNFEAFSGIIIHYLRCAEFRPQRFRVTLKFNGERYECSRELLSTFIGLQEIEGSESVWATRLVKQVLRCQFASLCRSKMEEFVVNFVNFLTSQKNLTTAEYNIYLEILFTLSPLLATSEVFLNLGSKNGRLLRLLNHYETSDAITSQSSHGEARGPKADRLRFAQANYYRILSDLTRREPLRVGPFRPQSHQDPDALPEWLLFRVAGGGRVDYPEVHPNRKRTRTLSQVD